MHSATERTFIMDFDAIANATAHSESANADFYTQSIDLLIADGFNQKQAEAIYSFGYSHGHSSGNSEIAYWMSSAVELAKSLQES